MAWRYYHNGTPASGERPLSDDERDELRRVSSRSTFFCAWPLAVTAATSVHLAFLAKTGDLWVVVALFPWLILGFPAAMHSYHLFRDRGIATEALRDGIAITVSLESEHGPTETVDLTANGYVLGAERTIFRYAPPLSIAKVAIAEPSNEPGRQLTAEEMEELRRRGRFGLATTDCCCAPLVLLPSLFFAGGGEWVAYLALFLGAVSVAVTVLLVRNSFRAVRHCRAAL